MTILHEYGIGNDKKVRYNLTQASGSSLKDYIGQRLNIKAYILFDAEDVTTNEVHRTLKILTDEGEYIGTRSKSFIRGFEDFLACMESDECTEMGIEERQSKQGRNYLTFIA